VSDRHRLTGAMVPRGDHWHAAGMLTFQHDHLARRGRPHRHMDAAGQVSGPDSKTEPIPAQLQSDHLARHTIYPKPRQ
jgi:hypothetical protein